MDIRKIIRNIISENFDGGVIAYHGTPFGMFDKFDSSRRGEGADANGFGDYGNGFYFTPYKQEAISYATKLMDTSENTIHPVLYTVKLQMNNPFDLRKLSAYLNEVRRAAKEVGGFFNLEQEHYDNAIKISNSSEDEIELMKDIENSMDDNWGDWDFATRLKDHGYDSVINPDGNEYVVFDSEQIQILDREKL